jgi:predicted phage terminase large subunit-like protein
MIEDSKKHMLVPRKDLDVVLTCDPAISEKSAACRSALIVLGMNPFQKIFVLDYWVGRQGDPAKLIQTMLGLADQWQPRVIGIESVAFQASMEPYTMREMASRGIYYPLQMLKPDRNEKKQQRILSMQPFFRAGQIYIQRGMLELIEEYETFPLGRTQDLLDAMAYGVRLLVPAARNKPAGLEERLSMMARRDPGSARYWRADAVKRGLIEPMQTIDELLDEEIEESQFEVGVGDFL